ncbi:MAG: cytochrome C [Deltaproteobacteria bacterium]|nr:cytochrome C [Deltaproteobacteria bacterium]
MKKLIVALMLVAFAASTALAVDVVTYAKDCKKGAVTFDHAMHGTKVVDSCANAACHGAAAPAKIAVDKKTAHKALCKTCHKGNAGPTKCGGCHIK